MTTPVPAFSWSARPAVGTRVVYRDPPHTPLVGIVVAVDEHAVRVRYDFMHDHHEPAILGRDGMSRLHPEGEQ